MDNGIGIAQDPFGAADADDSNLTVALFHHVPRPRQFKRVLRSAWERLDPPPTVGLRFSGYDCYTRDARHRPDVFVFDSLYLRHFVHQQYLLPLPEGLPRDREDFQGWALQASVVDGVRYGIPCHGCMTVLLYRADDQALNQDRPRPLTLGELEDIMGTAAPIDVPPPLQGTELLLDLSGRTTCAGMYLESWMDMHGANGLYPPPPTLPCDSATLDNMQRLLAMAGSLQAGYVDKDRDRLDWFWQGRGRALVGFTELLARVPDPSLIKLRPLPLSDTIPAQYLFVNLASISSAISPAKREPALKLLDLMTSTDVMFHSLRSDEHEAKPQFIIPVRRGVLDTLTKETPDYRVIGDLLAGDAGRPFLPFQFGPLSGEHDIRSFGAALRHDLLPSFFKVEEPPLDGQEPPLDNEASEEEKSRPVNLFRRD